MNRSKASREEGLTEEIRRQFGDRPTARFLRSMPMFRVVSDIPDHMRDLLDRLDGVGEDSGTKAR